VSPVRLTKLGHACVRVEVGQRRLVIDPGAWSDPAGLEGADVVLVTHQHVDHLDRARMRQALDADPAMQLWGPGDVVEVLGGVSAQVHVAEPGATIDVGGADVEVVGEWHATIHPDIPPMRNVGYLVAGTVLHPGDALIDPGRRLEALLVPVCAPWLKLGEVIDYVRAVAPARALPIHDKTYSTYGLAIVGRQLGPDGVRLGGTTYVPWVDGETVEVG
jgi:L-ascorbate metabolism protein UlaG (beta-lactamase superfamily)